VRRSAGPGAGSLAIDALGVAAADEPKRRFTKIGPFTAAALRLLLFTGCRLREILHLKWAHVDLERGLLFLADSKTGKKTVILNAPALAVLTGLDRLGSYVVPGDDPEKPRETSMGGGGNTCRT
jgi:integrase